MFMPYLYQKGEGKFRAITDGVGMSRYYALLNKSQRTEEEAETDSWAAFSDCPKCRVMQEFCRRNR